MKYVIPAIMVWVFVGCQSSMVLLEDYVPVDDLLSGESFEDAIIEDVQDLRRIPSICQDVDDCNDGDPCTIETCEQGLCLYEMKDIAFSEISRQPTNDFIQAVDLASTWWIFCEQQGAVKVMDITQTSNIQLAADLITVGACENLDMNGTGIIVAEDQDGFEVFSWQTYQAALHAPVDEDPLLEIKEHVTAVGIGPQYSIIGGYADGFTVLSFADVANPIHYDDFATSGRVVDTEVIHDTWGAVADSLGGTVFVDFSASSGPTIASTIHTEGRVVEIDIERDSTIVAEHGAGFSLIDASHYTNPQKLFRIPSVDPVISVAMMGQQSAFVLLEGGLLVAFDLRDVKDPQSIAAIQLDSQAHAIVARSGRIAVAMGKAGSLLLDTNCH